jgi:hypothetical protein
MIKKKPGLLKRRLICGPAHFNHRSTILSAFCMAAFTFLGAARRTGRRAITTAKFSSCFVDTLSVLNDAVALVVSAILFSHFIDLRKSNASNPGATDVMRAKSNVYPCRQQPCLQMSEKIE